MKLLISLISIVLFISICSCKKNKTSSAQNPDEFSFVYNGVTYNKNVTNNISDAGVFRYQGNPAILIDMPAVFGGRITFSSAGCAYLEPGSLVINVTDPNCQLSTIDSFGNHQPIDSVQVYIYQSGSLNITFSNCVTKSGTDLITGLPYSYQVCHASGTFDLTLANKNNQTIKITKGKVDEHIQF